MSPSSPAERRLLLLGRDHEEWGDVALHALSARTACAITRGSDPDSPGKRSKRHANEDALLVVEDDRRVTMVVADGHFGREASHEMLRVLDERLRPVPGTPEELREIFDDFRRSRSRPEYQGGTSLVVVIYDRLFRQGFGISFGDSTLAHVGPDGIPRVVNRRGGPFVSPADAKTFDLRHAHVFSFVAAPDDLLMVFTDGLDECNYGDPYTSVTAEVMAHVLHRTGREPRAFVDALMRLALAGVNGNPGGQDNVALAVTQV